MTAPLSSAPLTIDANIVKPGRRMDLELPVSRLPTGSTLSLPVTVINGRYAGPRLWLSAAIHGDELNGIASVRRALREIDARALRGSVIAAPVVNVFGVLTGDRYLPDRRDLNRSFPGSARGSLAARLAHLFMQSVVHGCDVGVDLHTGSHHRHNHPQIRADLDDLQTRRLAEAFGPPLLVHSRVRDGSLRGTAAHRGARVLVYEAGEALRFDEGAIELGTAGILRVMAHLGMRDSAPPASGEPMTVIRRSSWLRARRGGLSHMDCTSGGHVEKGDVLGSITDAIGGRPATVRAPSAGWVIGLNRNPLVNRGDALVHIGLTEEGSDS